MKHRFDTAESEAHFDTLEANYIAGQGHFDADESVFLAKELEYVRAAALTVKKTPLNSFTLFPVTTDIPEGAETALIKYFDGTGIAKLVSSYADNLPRVDVLAKQDSVKLFTAGVAYGYSVDELKNAMFANRPLDAMKASQARRGMDMLLNRLAFQGSAENGIVGFMNNTNVTQVVLTAGTGGVTVIANKQPMEMYNDLASIINSINAATNGVEVPNTVAMPPSLYNKLNTTIVASTQAGTVVTSTQTVLALLKANFPEVTRWLKISELTASKSGKDIVICGNFIPENIKMEIPNRFEQLPVERRNLEYVVDCVSRYAGVNVFVPNNFSYALAN